MKPTIQAQVSDPVQLDVITTILDDEEEDESSEISDAKDFKGSFIQFLRSTNMSMNM